jgi:hypothetical protein
MGDGEVAEARPVRIDELCFEQHGLSVETSRASDRLEVRLSGVAEMAIRDRLTRYLASLHEQAGAAGASQVVMDLSKLEFMNAACLRSFVSWIQRLLELPRGEQYDICFRSDGQVPWQRRSMNALRCFATDLITVETEI